MKKSPAFQFYPKEWLSSTKVSLMTPEQEGAYIHLLSHMWEDSDCSLEDNDQILAQLSRLGEKKWFEGAAEIIKKCFVPHPKKENFLTNSRLLFERKKQKDFSKKMKDSAKKRWDNEKSGHAYALRRQSFGNALQSPFTSTNNTSVFFENFWAAWPKSNRKVDKKKCASYWKNQNFDKIADLIMVGLEHWTARQEWQTPEYIPMPYTWLNNNRWEVVQELNKPDKKKENPLLKAETIRHRYTGVVINVADIQPEAGTTHHTHLDYPIIQWGEWEEYHG